MSNELALITGENFSREKIDLIKRTIAVGATDDELQLFLYTAQKTGLDPLTRQIYAVKRWNATAGREVMTVQTGIDGYRLIADRTDRLAGISDPMFDDDTKDFPGKATVTVKKLLDGGVVADFTATARWGEYVQTGKDKKTGAQYVTAMWKKMPFLMLGKCAEALALRKAFPADLSGVYTTEEMAQADNAQQGEAVFAEVERQKSAHTPKSYATVDASESIAEPTVPPELEWSYNKGSGVLICRVLEAKEMTKKGSKDTFVILKINGKVAESEKNNLYYWHASNRDALTGAIGKIVKLIVSPKGDFPVISEILEVAGEKVQPSGPSPETEARLLASTLDFQEEELRELHTRFCNSSWPETLEKLQAEKVRRETGAPIDEDTQPVTEGSSF